MTNTGKILIYSFFIFFFAVTTKCTQNDMWSRCLVWAMAFTIRPSLDGKYITQRTFSCLAEIVEISNSIEDEDDDSDSAWREQEREQELDLLAFFGPSIWAF